MEATSRVIASARSENRLVWSLRPRKPANLAIRSIVTSKLLLLLRQCTCFLRTFVENEVDSFGKILDARSIDDSCRAVVESEQEAQKSPRFQSEAITTSYTTTSESFSFPQLV